jgi:NTE family protein
VGNPETPDVDFNTGEAYLQFFVDELDNVSFPHSGGRFRIRLTSGLETLGSDVDYEQGTVGASLPYTRGRYTGILGADYETTRDNDAPFQSLFRLGGFTRLSGYEYNELTGQHLALLFGVFYRRMGKSSLVPMYAGFSVEYGNVFQDKSDIQPGDLIWAGSVFFGIDTPVGPFYIAYGHAEAGRGNYYLFLGQPPRQFRPGFSN